MIKQILFFVAFFTIILTPCFVQESVNQFDKDGERHGLWRKNYNNTNQLRYQGQFYHGKEINTFKYYKLKNGKSVLSAIKVFNKENDFANVTFFASDQKKISQGQMNGKTFTGKWIYYHKNSDQIMTIENYNSYGQLEGERVVYFKNGKVAESVVFKNGERNGLSKWFSETAVLLQESNYSNDKLNGITVYYENGGLIKAKGHYADNLKVGVWNYYKNENLNKKIDHTKDLILFQKQ